MKEMTVKLTFTDELLGTLPGNRDLFRDYVAGKAETVDEEAEAIPVDEQIEKGTTVFPRTKDGQPFLYDYQIRGYFKEACKFLKEVEGTKSSKVKAYKRDRAERRHGHMRASAACIHAAGRQGGAEQIRERARGQQGDLHGAVSDRQRHGAGARMAGLWQVPWDGTVEECRQRPLHVGRDRVTV